MIQGAARRLSNKEGWIARLITRSDARAELRAAVTMGNESPIPSFRAASGLSGHGWRGVGGGKFTGGSKSDLEPAF